MMELVFSNKKKVLTHAITWMALENIRLSKRSKSRVFKIWCVFYTQHISNQSNISRAQQMDEVGGTKVDSAALDPNYFKCLC